VVHFSFLHCNFLIIVPAIIEYDEKLDELEGWSNWIDFCIYELYIILVIIR
jgi:hypothetical protein